MSFKCHPKREKNRFVCGSSLSLSPCWVTGAVSSFLLSSWSRWGVGMEKEDEVGDGGEVGTRDNYAVIIYHSRQLARQQEFN